MADKSLSAARRLERIRTRLPEGSRRRRWFDALFLPIHAPTQFELDRAALAEQLAPRLRTGLLDEERTAEILAEAEGLIVGVDSRIEGAERRATTLQGAVAVASSLLVAGGGLIADPTKLRGEAWRVALGVLLLAVLASLLMAGTRALQASSTIHTFRRPPAEDILERVSLPAALARLARAAELLKCYAANGTIADWKVAHLGAAAWWFRIALAGFAFEAIGLIAYAWFGTS